MNMREKIARALYDRHWSALPETSRPPWPGDTGADYWDWLADAVLDAMREPSGDMEFAGRMQLEQCAEHPGGCTITAMCVWSTMIDAAKPGK